MSWMERFCLALLLVVIGVLAASPSRADEAIARRLAALRSLIDPASSREVLDSTPATPGCPDTAWWRVTPYAERTRMEQAVRDASLRYAVDPELIRSVIRVESNFDPDAVSHKGAMGLMQLMPPTARSLGVVCPFDPRENVLGGTRYLRELRNLLGTWPRALAAYHAGPKRVVQRRIPAGTRSYVRRILRLWQPHRLASLDLG